MNVCVIEGLSIVPVYTDYFNKWWVLTMIILQIGMDQYIYISWTCDLCSHTGPHIQKDPALGLISSSCYLKFSRGTLNKGPLHFIFALDSWVWEWSGFQKHIWDFAQIISFFKIISFNSPIVSQRKLTSMPQIIYNIIKGHNTHL